MPPLVPSPHASATSSPSTASSAVPLGLLSVTIPTP
uniref:Uncharacterized protein n=1 Tax=Fagus sylvatica TaxID=28930 RepID=A0A2N9EI48_FAGSY